MVKKHITKSNHVNKLKEESSFYYDEKTIRASRYLELLESLGSLLALSDLEDVETDSLGEGTALTNSDDITTM